jgi:hypothetical protein
MDPKDFKLRIWEERNGMPHSICVSIENPQTGARIGFTDWDSLLAFLNQQRDGEQFNRQNVTKLFEIVH